LISAKKATIVAIFSPKTSLRLVLFSRNQLLLVLLRISCYWL
jgi:hypothetical protein